MRLNQVSIRGISSNATQLVSFQLQKLNALTLILMFLWLLDELKDDSLT